MTKILKENEEVECPICKQKHLMTLYDSVNVQLNPELKEKVFKGEINSLPCTNGLLLGPFLYVDGNIWVWIYPGFMIDQKEKIEVQLQEMKRLDRKYFRNKDADLYYVFGYDQFLELSEKLDKGKTR